MNMHACICCISLLLFDKPNADSLKLPGQIAMTAAKADDKQSVVMCRPVHSLRSRLLHASAMFQ